MTRIPLAFGLIACVGLTVAATPAFAQFNQQAGLVPGPVVWSEGVVAFDANGDGLMDICFANGDGFNGAGTKRLPTLLINNGVVASNPQFLDQTGTRIPNITLNAKGVLAFDKDNDGDQDLFFSIGFGQSQKLYENDGSGFFTDVTATQFTGIALNSFGASAFDMDNDGDLDLAVCDHGGTSLFGNGQRMRLFENDGTGDFTQVTGNLPLQSKTSQQNVTAVDIDNDFDLDLVLDGRSTPQHVYFNDGTGMFSIDTGLIPAGSSNIYETDWADMDGDGDVDSFYISYSGFSEGTARNNLIPSGSLTFTGGTNTIIGTNSHDDNEVCFVDYDNDGDLDPLVGSLSGPREKLYRNNGNFTFTFTNLVSSQGDPTLDCTTADFDGDGDYDLITAQGEGSPRVNRYYRNDGAADTAAPDVVDTRVADPSFPPVVLAKVTDEIADDGMQVTVNRVDYTITPLVGAPIVGSADMMHSGGYIHRAVLDPDAPPGVDFSGATVTWTVVAEDLVGNSGSTAAPSFTICESTEYGLGAGGANVLGLTLTGVPSLGSTITIGINGGQPNAAGVFLLGGQRASIPALGGTLLVGGPVLIPVSIAVGPLGSINLSPSIPNDSNLIGVVFDLQVILGDAGQPAGAALSNGLELCISG